MPENSIVLRTPSGISGDMMLTGLSRLCDVSEDELNAIVDQIGLEALSNCAKVVPHSVNNISGWRAEIDLPHEHHHRTYATIIDLIESSTLDPDAKILASKAFKILGEAEAKVHNAQLSDVHFHEVGALDSILDTCVAAALFTRIAPKDFFCSPLPICDGTVNCEHGLLATPPPAVQEMLSGIPVYGVDASGETVTPTALAFLKAAGAQFGNWPECKIGTSARAYGGKVFPNLPNGAIFFLVKA